jgi:DNA polymerase-3 subunit alpha
MPALAVTDHGNMYGAIEFYQYCKKKDIKPIFGFEAYVANRTRFDKQPGIDNKRYHLTLLAENFTGYKNLMKLVTKSSLEGYYYKPRVDKELLKECAEGLICLSGCLGSELGRAVQSGDEAEAYRVIDEYQNIFGKDNYYLEIMAHDSIADVKTMREFIIRASKKTGIPLVATQDSHYLHKDDKHAHETLLAINTDGTTTDANRYSFGEMDGSFINGDEAYELFKDTPEACDNTLKIAERCNVELTLGKFIFPNFPLPEGKSADDFLREKTFAGIERRGLTGKPEVVERLEYELGIIKMKGYAAYFHVVEDLIRFATERNIYSNIRGSVAGSMTTYLLGITKIDPLVYKIPFERFLNPERPSAPDIDMDFADNRREEVLEYTKEKYGHDYVAQVGTFGTMLARGSVRDVARALGHPYILGDSISKLIPLGSQGFPMTIEHAFEVEPELQKMYDADPKVKDIIDIAKKLEGCVRHVSVHAAGVVIAPNPLIEYAPLQLDPKGGKIITQYDMYTVGEDGVGLTKFDFLGIRNLSILADAVRIVKAVRNEDIDIEAIPLDDKKTFQMLARGETMGLFQLNGQGMTKFLKDLKATSIHDINAMVALYRPGPIQFIPEYIKRKHNPELVSYLDPALEKILKQTYGILVYQDDLLMMAHDLAGYSWGEVDKFRKAVGKKIPAEMEAQKEKFIKGCVAVSKWPQKKAEEIWAWIEPFAAYGFNKAHSASYGRVAYQTSYMKANFPAEYMTAVLTAESGDVDEVAAVIDECKRMKIPVLPPSINESLGDFAVVKKASGDEIRFGLYTIKNLGTEIANSIIENRTEHGFFKSLADFFDRVRHKNLNKKSLEALIKSGAMDELGERGAMIFNLDDALQYNKEAASTAHQSSLFGLLDEPHVAAALTLKLAPPATLMEKLAWEKELLGLYISGHPLEKHREKFEKSGITITSIKAQTDGAVVAFGGLIEELKAIFTKKGDHMAFMKVSDFTNQIEVVVFPKVLEEFKAIAIPEKCVAIRGRLSFRNGEPSIIASAFKSLDE